MLFVWIPANAGSWHDQKNEVKSTKQLSGEKRKHFISRIILAMSVPALVKQWFEVGEHRYEVVRYDGSKARPKGLMKVVKWATIESNAALAISNGGQIITPSKVETITTDDGVRAVLQRFDMPGRAKARAQQNEAAEAPAQAAGAAREGRGTSKRTQRVVTQAEPVAIGSSSAWEFQRDLRKEQRRRESGALASLISTLDHDLTLCSFAGRVGVPRPLCSSFPAG